MLARPSRVRRSCCISTGVDAYSCRFVLIINMNNRTSDGRRTPDAGRRAPGRRGHHAMSRRYSTLDRLRSAVTRIAALLRGRRLDRELDEEIQSHLQMLAQDHMRRGMTPASARDEARRAF